MAFPWVTFALLLVLALASIESSMCDVVKGKVSCLDCKQKDDLPDVNVLVQCINTERSTTATTTKKDGSFEAQLPTDPSSTNCEAQILGGSQQLCSYRNTMTSKIVKANETNTYTISTPLAYATSCPSKARSAAAPAPMVDSSMTFNFPFPKEWGLPPTSLWVPIFPIGIP